MSTLCVFHLLAYLTAIISLVVWGGLMLAAMQRKVNTRNQAGALGLPLVALSD